ncbi:MAG: type 4b pilus protein PilO2 [Rickettsiales bacterium]|nr:type 4b pilus protein PilO2 [Rickettsiales bacterium]
MTAQIVSVSRKKYAVGLFWQPVAAAHAAKGVAERISKSAPQARFRYYAQYRNLVGLGSPALKHYSGLSALAPEVMESFGDAPSFAAVFKVGGGYWMIAVRNGIILSDQDRLFAVEKDAREAFDKLLQLPDWSLKVAPESWGITGAQERNIDDVISGKVRSALRPIGETSGLMLKLLVFGAAAIALVYFFEADINRFLSPGPAASQMTEESARLYKEQLALMKSDLAAPETIAPAGPVMPWETIPPANEVAALCTKAIAFIMQPVYGWNVVSADCANGKIHAVIRRDYGTIQELYEAVGGLMPGVEIKTSGAGGSDAELSGTWPLAAAVANAPAENIAAVERRVRSVFQMANMPAAISVGKEIVASQGGDVKRTAEYVLVRADSKIMPEEFMKFLEIPAVELLSVSWDMGKSQWSYEVRVYAL